MKKLQIFQTYYKDAQYTEYNLDKLPDFVEVINTNTYDYPHNSLNPFWSEYMFMKYVYENIDKYDCEYIGFDQYKNHFNYDDVLDRIQSSEDICIINHIENVDIYKQYSDEHKKKDMDALLNILTENHHEDITKYITKGRVPFFWGSCFVMKKEKFVEMGNILFSVLDKLDAKYKLNYSLAYYDRHFIKEFKKKQEYSKNVLKHPQHGTEIYQRRCFGYLGERILGTWIMLNYEQQNKIVEIPLIKRINPQNAKNVLLISHVLDNTGAPRALFNMGKILQQNGYTVAILSPKGGSLEREIRESGIRYVVIKDLVERLKQRNPTLLKLMSWAGYAVFNTIVTAAYSVFFAGLQVKRILWIHEGTFGFSVYKTLINQNIFSTFDEIYAVGEYARGIAQQHTRMQVKTLNYSISDRFIKSVTTQPSNDLHIAIIGSIGLRKGYDLILLAMKELSIEERRHLYFYFVGNPENSHFKDIIKKYDVPNIKYLQELPNNKVLDFMNYCDCLLCPSRDDPMPICCTEALMMQKPIIVSKNTGTASFIKDGKNGFLVDSKPKSIADGIRRAIANKDNLNKIGKQGRKIYTKNFTDEVFEENIKKIFS